MGTETPRLATVEAFRDLSLAEHEALDRGLEPIAIPRGEALIRQGDEADALYLVMSGRFEVLLDGREQPISEIGVGSPIGEIGFFSGGRRTATVRAERDSLVLKLTREEFERLAERNPRIWNTITATLARRLAETTAGERGRRNVRPRTIAVARAGSGAVPPEFIAKLKSVFEARSRAIVLDERAARAASSAKGSLDADAATSWFNELESRFDYVIYVADQELTPWSEKAIRQADLVVFAADHRAGAFLAEHEPNALERFAAGLHGTGNMRLVLLHDRRRAVTGTSAWLEPRPWLAMHHHVALDTLADFERLFRFISGTAVGLVACGGGAFSAAHIGVYEALLEAGISFDVMGGTSGGGAMTAAFALGANPDEIERRTHDMFVTRKAMRRWTWPRYSLLDHTELDQALALNYTSIDIEDLWVPYFAVSTNLSRNATHCHRRGPLWQAVRASSAIPALLPPFFTAEGEMLVDGCLLDNVPVQAMRALKTGPNIVVDFNLPRMDRCRIDYAELPSRWSLMWRSLTRSGREALPKAPGPHAILMRSLMLNRRDFAGDLDDGDILLKPRMPAGVGHLDWHKHGLVREKAHEFTSIELARLKANGHPLLQAK